MESRIRKIAPSLAAAPLDRLGEVVSELEQAKVNYIHFDVEDGSFTPVMTLGTRIIKDLRPLSQIPFDVHLMMVEPEWLLPELKSYGADRVAVHLEACPYPRRTLRKIAALDMTPGLALNPVTLPPDLSYLQPYLKYIILLSTEPEEPDCPFIPEVLDKIKIGVEQHGMDELEWVVDGGVNNDNINSVFEAGADTVVVGRSTFLGGSIQTNIKNMRKAIE
jgi:ribulose-phosphate 3-epimerase